jgi:aldose 1-epimerase
MKHVILLLTLSIASTAQNYTAQETTDHGVRIVRLTDSARGVEVSIAPSIGNRAYEMKVHGKNILYFPPSDLAEFQKRPGLNGIPLLAPWANRLNEPDFWANGKKYEFNMGLGNVSKDNHGLPIHGMLTTSPLWRVTEVAADQQSAHVTSRLEFWKYPDLMAQWPFAQEYEMTYRLSDGMLEVRMTVANLSAEPMPIVIGFHPYYRIPGVPRDEWMARLPARQAVVTDDRLIPTGELKPFDLPNPLPLKGRTLDNSFTDLERDADGRAHFSIESGGAKVEVLFGPKYPVAVIWEPAAPPGQARDFICFEPMTAVTSGVNLQHEGKYSGLQMLPAGARWTESFWIRASGI